MIFTDNLLNDRRCVHEPMHSDLPTLPATTILLCVDNFVGHPSGTYGEVSETEMVIDLHKLAS
jgi:hypothetical protein